MKFIKITVPHNNRQVWINVETIERFEAATPYPGSRHKTNIWLRGDPDAWGIEETVEALVRGLQK
jgi:hypothetical protein